MDEVRHLFRAVAEGIGPGGFLDIVVVNVRVRMIETNSAFEPKLRGTVGEARDVEVVAERILGPADARRRGGDHELRVDQALVMAVARTQHHAMLAEADRLPVLVGRDVLDGQRGHSTPRSTCKSFMQVLRQ